MKILASIIAVIVVGIVGYVVLSPQTEPVATPIDTPITTEALPVETKETKSDLEVTHAEPGGDAALGTDLNMEFPTLDSEEAGVTIDQGAVIFTIFATDLAYNLKEMRVKGGDTVVVNFTSENGFADWGVDEFDARTRAVQAGGTTSVTFVADKEGTFEYYSSVGNHRANGMVGTLIVE